MSRRCVLDFEWNVVLKEAHEGVTHGHFFGESIGNYIFLAGSWWPIVFKDAFNIFRQCQVYQRDGKLTISDGMP